MEREDEPIAYLLNTLPHKGLKKQYLRTIKGFPFLHIEVKKYPRYKVLKRQKTLNPICMLILILQ